MRAALLPAGGDPFLIAYWLRNYQTWADQVDILRIVVCDQADPEIQAYLRRLTEALPHVLIRFTHRTDHGEVIRQLVAETNADTVLLCEDDAFVRDPARIGEAFGRIESGETDVVGCPRATGSAEILAWANTRFGDQIASSGESGPLLWPCFLFARRDDLLRTDCHFGAWGRSAGESILGVTFPTDQALDTFGWTTLQLRELGLRIRIEGNYRAQLERLTSWTDAPWFHVGGLSTGHGLYLLGDRTGEQERWDVIRSDPYDWQKRISWWRRVAEKWDGALPEHHDAYLREIDRYMAGTGMDLDAVAQWRRGFDALISWTE